jgi:2-polyprenyl-3-methyl-5-hydroxy-6-metoxy-1,4-benzoquinol methylase
MSFQSTENINSDFFKGIYKDVWRKEIPAGLTEAEADFIEEVAHLKNKDNVLDIMCGYGRHSLELARRGYNVSALDNSREYIDEIKIKTSQEKLSVDAVHKDVSETTFPGQYDAVICMGNSFAFFNAETAFSILKKLFTCLRSGGVFIINTWTIAEIVIKTFQERTWHYIDDYKFLTESKYLFHPTRIESNYTILTSSGKTETLKGIDYIFSFSELETMLNEAGFKMTEVYSTPRKRKYNFGDPRAYILATKQ